MKKTLLPTGKMMSLVDIIETEKKKTRGMVEFWKDQIEDEKKNPGSHIIPFNVSRGTYPSVSHFQLELATEWAQALETANQSHPRMARIVENFNKGYYFG